MSDETMVIERVSDIGWLDWSVRRKGTSEQSVVARFDDEDDARAFAAMEQVAAEVQRLRAHVAHLESEDAWIRCNCEHCGWTFTRPADPLAAAKDAVCEAADGYIESPTIVNRRKLVCARDALAARRREQGEKE